MLYTYWAKGQNFWSLWKVSFLALKIWSGGITNNSGKSSLLALLLCLIEIREGNVCIDGQEISNIDRESLRLAIFAVPQNLCFVSQTIRDNLVSGLKHRISDQELEQRLSQVSLWPKISSLPNGLSTAWTDELFSDGQKQLLAFTKAMLSKCPIVVVDEISSQSVLLPIRCFRIKG